MSKFDPVPTDIRNIEAKIDLVYKSNPLTKKNFAYSAWFYSAFSQEFIARDALNISDLSIHQLRYTTENHTECLNHGLKWLFQDCPNNGNFIRKFDDDDYGYANSLFELALNYHIFSIVLTYASRGLIEVKLEGDNIICDRPPHSEWEYEAYNRLIQEKHTEKFNIQEFPITPDNISLTIDRSKFSYAYGSNTILKLQEFFKYLNEARFQLPDEWDFGKFKLIDFKAFYEIVFCLCVLRFNARLWALNMGVLYLGFEGSIIVLDQNQLRKQIVSYSGLEENVVSSIMEYLTYGSYGFRNIDPAIQPLIKLNENQIAIIPSIIITSSAERNLTVLLNKLPSERKIYLSLVNEKEDLMAENLRRQINHLSIRFADKIKLNTRLPDVDCALIDDNNKECCIIELKWFIDPSEVREIIEKSQELKKGVDQLLELKKPNVNQIVKTKLKIYSDYTFYYLLVSANWIGFSDVQNPEIPIISEDIFIKKIKASTNLHEILKWLNSRSYLPQKGVHFDIEEVNTQIDKWSFNWYAIKPLISEVFDPI